MKSEIGGGSVAVSEAHIRATRKYEAAHYDAIRFDVPKGDKERIQAAAQAAGQSLAAYIREAIARRMTDDKGSV